MPLLGNVVISKKFLRTHKIMVMHNNERGECCLRTLIDRQGKRCHNVEEVVVRLPDPTNPSIERTAPPSSAHIQLGDVPRAPIQLSVEGEFCQHDGVMMVMMFYRCRASPKHRYDYRGGLCWRGAPHTAKRSRDQLLCLWGAPWSRI